MTRGTVTRRGAATRATLGLGAICALMTTGADASAQAVRGTADSVTVAADSTDLLSVGRAAQVLFERLRLRHLPVTLAAGGGADCDEYVGRFCTWYSEGEWVPEPDPPEIVELRGELLVQLDELQTMLPGDPWLLGQRVWYRTEAGLWEDAVETARACGVVDVWWCRALEGFALHGSGAYEEAAVAFDVALAEMPVEQAELWREPRRAVEPSVRRLFDRAAQAGSDSLAAVLDRVWEMADPLYLVPGNDRRTAHFARWTVSTLREEVRNPFNIRWGRDLEELTIRHGWEIGWERSPQTDFSDLNNVVGHKHPEARDFMPGGDALGEPQTVELDGLIPDKVRPRSLYAPSYAPVLLPMRGQLAIFTRIDETVIVATHQLPDDTTFHAEHDHPIPWLEPGDQAELADRAGLFAVPLDGRRALSATSTGSTEGVLTLRVPTGSYFASIESWSPSRRRAGRVRFGVPERRAVEDVVTLSDLLLTHPTDTTLTVLEEAAPLALPTTEITPDQRFGIAWEVVGLGFRAEQLRFELSVRREGVSVFRRLGELVGLANRPQPLELSWEEPGPERPEPMFRHLDLELPTLDPGEYEISLTVRTESRSPATVTRRFRVLEE